MNPAEPVSAASSSSATPAALPSAPCMACITPYKRVYSMWTNFCFSPIGSLSTRNTLHLKDPTAGAGRAGWEPLSLDIQPTSNQQAGRTRLVGLWTDKRRRRTHQPCLIPSASSLLQTGTASPTRAVAWAANTDSQDATTMYPSRYHDHHLLF